MKRVSAFFDKTAHEIARKTARFGQSVMLDASIFDRSDSIKLSAPGLVSANGSCRLIKAQDGWIAANLPRPEDIESIPALIGDHVVGDAWQALHAKAATLSCAELIARAQLLALALAKVGETKARKQPYEVQSLGTPKRPRASLRVVDFSSLWAGPLCGSIFAAMGADVTKIESQERPDTTAHAAPHLDQRLNGAKKKLALPIATHDGLAALHNEIARSDILITSARARALEGFDLIRKRIFAANPSLIWIAITGHGFDSPRIAFGDDAAASGGLLAWEGDEPRFIGDALADPLTGIAAANAALDALEKGEGGFIDASLAQAAAFVAALRP